MEDYNATGQYVHGYYAFLLLRSSPMSAERIRTGKVSENIFEQNLEL